MCKARGELHRFKVRALGKQNIFHSLSHEWSVLHTDERRDNCALAVYGQRGSCLPPTLNPLGDSIAQENAAMKRAACNLIPAHPLCLQILQHDKHTHTQWWRQVSDRKCMTELLNKWGKATPPSILGLGENSGKRKRLSLNTVSQIPPHG